MRSNSLFQACVLLPVIGSRNCTYWICTYWETVSNFPAASCGTYLILMKLKWHQGIKIQLCLMKDLNKIHFGGFEIFLTRFNVFWLPCFSSIFFVFSHNFPFSLDVLFVFSFSSFLCPQFAIWSSPTLLMTALFFLSCHKLIKELLVAYSPSVKMGDCGYHCKLKWDVGREIKPIYSWVNSDWLSDTDW